MEEARPEEARAEAAPAPRARSWPLGWTALALALGLAIAWLAIMVLTGAGHGTDVFAASSVALVALPLAVLARAWRERGAGRLAAWVAACSMLGADGLIAGALAREGTADVERIWSSAREPLAGWAALWIVAHLVVLGTLASTLRGRG